MSSWFDRRNDPDCPHHCEHYGYEGRCPCFCSDGMRHVTDDGQTVYLCAGHRARREPSWVHLAPWSHPEDPKTRVTFARKR